MEIFPQNHPRKFTVKGVTISHVATVTLEFDEMVTFRTKGGAEYDVAAKEWGFYATPSLNRRLPDNGFRPALVKNPEGMRYILLVEKGKEAAFNEYCDHQSIKLLGLLDEEKLQIAD